ncbi:MFS transporter [Bradyrhizobium erythrophlei]|uniref:MFS transporter n=1 Tax=Bradyrhizobium erythrophlei TaxID=1437360 RepID=UPI0035E94A6E
MAPLRDRLGGRPIAYGILMADFGIRAFSAGVSSSFFRRIISRDRLIMLACVACVVCSISLALTSSLAVAVTLPLDLIQIEVRSGPDGDSYITLSRHTLRFRRVAKRATWR